MAKEIEIEIDQNQMEFTVEQHSLWNDLNVEIDCPVTKFDIEINPNAVVVEIYHTDYFSGKGTSDSPLDLSEDFIESFNNKLDKVDTPEVVYGTDEEGNQTTYSIDSFGKVEDVWVDGHSVLDHKIAKIDLTGKIDHFITMPPAQNNIGLIAQYIGETNIQYIQGYFYKSVHVISPTTVNFETTVVPSTDVEFNEETFLENVQPEAHHLIWMLTYIQAENAWYYNGQQVDPAFYGITYVASSVKDGDTFRIEYTPGVDSYIWKAIDVQENLITDVQLNGHSVVENHVANIIPGAADVTYTNPAVGSIDTVQEALDNLMNIHYYINPSYSIFTVSNSGQYDVGRVISNPFSINWSLNKQPEGGDSQLLKLDNVTILDIMAGSQSMWQNGTYSYTDQDISSDTPRNFTFRIDYVDNHSTVPSGKTNTCSATRSIQFMYRRYWGVTDTTTLSDEQLYLLTNELSTTRAQERDFNCTGGKYWWFVIPTTYCNGITFTDVASGLPMTLPPSCISTRTITNQYGISYSVNIYRTEYQQTSSSVKIRIS